jgi:parallel beta-helix repeat protein
MKLAATAITLLMLSSMLVPVSLIPASDVATATSSRGPIRIASDADFTPANGVVGGQGTSSAPYLISDWVIDAAGGPYGIQVGNTTKYFAVSRCAVSNVAGNNSGIALFNALNGLISDCAVSSSGGCGIQLYTSSACSVDSNIITGSGYAGICLYMSNGNAVSGNRISGGPDGMVFAYSQGNLVSENDVNGSGLAAGLYASSGNQIWSNAFRGAGAYDDTGTSQWNTTYPSGGNYWSAYAGTDHFSGPRQDQPGSDGIADAPYQGISGSTARDSYPLMMPPSLPGAPTDLALAAQNAAIALSWKAPADLGSPWTSSYLVYRSVAPANFSAPPIAVLPAASLSYVDLGVRPATTYYYEVVAANEIGNGPASARASCFPLGYAHGPIVIRSNADFTLANGVSYGDGSAANPWIIENWDVISSGSGPGINITGTTGHFLIRHCTVHRTDTHSLASSPGIFLGGLQNGIVDNCTLFSNRGTGILLANCTGTKVVNVTSINNIGSGMAVQSCNGIALIFNNISGNSYFGLVVTGMQSSLVRLMLVIGVNGGAASFTSCSGCVIRENLMYSLRGDSIDMTGCTGNSILMNTLGGGAAPSITGHCLFLQSSNNNTIDRNMLSNASGRGIMLADSNDNLATNNTIQNTWSAGVGIANGQRNVVRANNISNNVNSGVVLGGSYNVVTQNEVLNNLENIVLNTAENNTVSYNTITGGADGVYLVYGGWNHMVGNYIAGSSVGIRTGFSNCNEFVNNTLIGNGMGLDLYEAKYSLVTMNYLRGNSGCDISFPLADYNMVYRNTVIRGGGSSASSTTNAWNASYPTGGNFWSDYAGADRYSGPLQDQPGSDGIGDTPYSNFTGGTVAQDHYPLMNAVSLPGAPADLTARSQLRSMSLQWSAPASMGSPWMTSYAIYRGTDPSTIGGTPIATVAAGTLAYSDANVTVGTTYYYSVKAINALGPGPASNVAHDKHKDDPQPSQPFPTTMVLTVIICLVALAAFIVVGRRKGW